MSGTPRLSLPFLSAGQAQKEFMHNEALQQIDIALAAAVEETPRDDAPASPALGACYIVGPSAVAEWAGKSQSIASFTSGGWRFLAPVEGMTAYIKSTAIFATYRSGEWEFGTLRGSTLMLGGQQVVGSRGGAITLASGGATVDSEGRAAIEAILSALRDHGLIET